MPPRVCKRNGRGFCYERAARRASLKAGPSGRSAGGTGRHGDAAEGVRPDQAAIGLPKVSTASVMRAESGAKEASASFSAASCSFAVSVKLFSSAMRA